MERNTKTKSYIAIGMAVAILSSFIVIQSIVNAPAAAQAPTANNVVVYIFKRDTSKFQLAGDLESKVSAAVGVDTVKDKNIGASKAGIYDASDKLVGGASVQFVIDPSVTKANGTPLTVADIPNDMAFGNGVTVGGIQLANGEIVDTIHFVFSSADAATVTANLEKIRQVLATESPVPEGYIR